MGAACGSDDVHQLLALFPLLTVAAAVAAGTLGADQQQKLEDKIGDQVPGIADQLDIGALVDNAGTIVVAGALLLFDGRCRVGRFDAGPPADRVGVARQRGEPGSAQAQGRRGAGGARWGGARLAGGFWTVASTAVGWTADQVGIDREGWGGLLLQVAAFAVAVLADFLLLLYVLTLLPVQPPRRDLVTAALIGAAGFELLKMLLGGYMKGVAAKSMAGAFGTPVALLLWINFTAKLVLFCSAWTAIDRGRRGAGGGGGGGRADGDDGVEGGPADPVGGPNRPAPAGS